MVNRVVSYVWTRLTLRDLTHNIGWTLLAVTVAHNRGWATRNLVDALHGMDLSDEEPDDDDEVLADPGGTHQDHVPMRRVVGPDGKMEFQTKHDLVLTARRNARRLEKVRQRLKGWAYTTYGVVNRCRTCRRSVLPPQLPLEFQSGNTEDDPTLRLSNRVYNQLRAHSMRTSAHSNEKDHSRLHGKEEFATSERAMDQRTRLMVNRATRNGVPFFA